MKRRPWPIVVLALLQITSPLGDWISSAWASGMSPGRYFAKFVHDSGLFASTMDLFGLPWLSAWSVFVMKAWSYPVFFLITIWNSYQTVASAWQATHSGHSYLSMTSIAICVAIVTLANLGMGAYLLIPRVRKPYFERSMRWWESLPRYGTELAGTFNSGPGFTLRRDCSVVNLSIGGALVTMKGGQKHCLKMNDDVTLGFGEFFAEGRVAHVRDESMYGIEFTGMSRASRAFLKSYIDSLERAKVRAQRTQSTLLTDIAYWFAEFRRHQAERRAATVSGNGTDAGLASVTAVHPKNGAASGKGSDTDSDSTPKAA